ncbi:SDR family NAD(P)-dependent oxidoreductase [Chloroflexota bacterium]
MKLAGKVALVTGASSGIGAAIGRTLAGEGASIVIGYRRNTEGAERTASEVRELGGKALVARADISKQDEVEGMVRKTIEEFGRLDILVNNAASMNTSYSHFHETSLEEVEETINVDFKGMLNCCRAVIPYMMERNWGRIISITSDAAKVPNPRAVVYSGCKAAIAGASRGLAGELARYGILVNCIAAGYVATEQFMKMPPDTQQRVLAGTLLRRAGEPEDIANMVLFLASDDGKYITGQHISVSGGVSTY